MWRVLGLHGGECWVTWWRGLGYICGVLGYMVECWVTWWRVLYYMLDYIEVSAGLPGDFPIRGLLFNTSWWGRGCWKKLANDPEKITTSLTVKKYSTLPLVYIVYIPKFNWF